VRSWKCQAKRSPGEPGRWYKQSQFPAVPRGPGPGRCEAGGFRADSAKRTQSAGEVVRTNKANLRVPAGVDTAGRDTHRTDGAPPRRVYKRSQSRADRRVCSGPMPPTWATSPHPACGKLGSFRIFRIFAPRQPLDPRGVGPKRTKRSQLGPGQDEGQVLGGERVMVNRARQGPRQNKADLSAWKPQDAGRGAVRLPLRLSTSDCAK
jgi:hypothetical protein